MYEGFLKIADIEVMNAPRTYAYARNAGFASLRQVYAAPDLPRMLLQEQYRSPALDGAPWFVPWNPDSNNFYGWLPTGWTGFDESTESSTEIELVDDGGVSSIPRATSRELRIKGVLMAKDEHALEFGMTWLRGVFDTQELRQDAGCDGEAITFLSSTPSMCPEAAEPLEPYNAETPYHECLVGYLRQFHRVTTLQGVRVITRFSAGVCPKMIEVEVLLTAGVPHIYTWPLEMGQSQEGPTRVIENLVLNPEPQSGSSLGYSVPAGATMGQNTTMVEPWPTTVAQTVVRPSYTGQPNYIDISVPDFVPGQRHTVALAVWPGIAGSPSSVPTVNARTVQALYRTGGPAQTVITSPVLFTSEDEQQNVRWEFVLPTTAVDLTIRVNAHSDSLGVGGVIVALTGDLDDDGFFSGDTPDTENWTYFWSGAANASTSIAEYRLAPPFTVPNVICDPSADPVILYDNLAPIPGPDADDSWFYRSLNPERFAISRVSSGSLVATAGGHASSQAKRVRRTAVLPDNLFLALQEVGGRMPVRDDTLAHYFSLWAAVPVAGAVVSGVIGWYNGSGTALGTSTLSNRTVASAGAWARYGWTALNPPAGTVQARVDINVRTASGNAPDNSNTYLSSVLFTDGLVPPWYFDGSTPDTAEYDFRWTGAPFRSRSIAVSQVLDPFRDPDCVFIPLPPQPPIVDDPCLTTPDTWVRYSVPIPPDVPGFANVPIVTLEAGDEDVRQVRLRIYPDPSGGGAPTVEECDYIGEFMVTYLPAGASLVIDARLHTAYVTLGSTTRSALHLLRGSEGKPFTWPVAYGQRPYVLTADFVPASPNTVVSLAVAGRT